MKICKSALFPIYKAFFVCYNEGAKEEKERDTETVYKNPRKVRANS